MQLSGFKAPKMVLVMISDVLRWLDLLKGSVHPYIHNAGNLSNTKTLFMRAGFIINLDNQSVDRWFQALSLNKEVMPW